MGICLDHIKEITYHPKCIIEMEALPQRLLCWQ